MQRRYDGRRMGRTGVAVKRQGQDNSDTTASCTAPKHNATTQKQRRGGIHLSLVAWGFVGRCQDMVGNRAEGRDFHRGSLCPLQRV